MILKAYDKNDNLVSAKNAAKTHKEGDRYEDPLTGKPLRLHIQRTPTGPRHHFEWEPRWEAAWKYVD